MGVVDSKYSFALPPTDGLPRVHWAGEFRSGDAVPFHHHDGPEMILVTGGSCTTSVGGQPPLLAGPGDLYLIPSDVDHDQHSLPYVHTFYVSFSPGPVFGLGATPRLIPLQGEPLVRTWIRTLCHLRHKGDNSWDDSASYLLLAILHRLAHVEGQRRDASALDPRLRLAVAFLRSNLTRNVSLDEIANAADISVSLTKLLFGQQLHVSPARYHRQLRIALAQHLLADPYLSVKQVASRCGYTDTNYFVRQFHNIAGAPPGVWRTRQTK